MVAALAASAAGVLAGVAITATRRVIRSEASSGSRSTCPAAQRNSIVTFWPSIKPASLKPLRNAETSVTFGSAETGVQKPDHGYRALLRARRERPSYRSAEQREKLAAFPLIELHSISPPAREG